MFNRSSFIGLAAAVLAATSQNASAGTPQDERPEIYLKTATAAGTSIFLSSVDGVRVSSFFKRKLRLSSGLHELTLSTGFLYLRNSSDQTAYRGSFTLTFDAKEGMSYIFAIDPPVGGVGQDSQLCIYEEARNDPDADITAFGDFRHPGPNATRLQCSPIDVQPL